MCERAAALQKGDRLLVATMGFEPFEPAVRELVAALAGAARRGARVTLSVDACDFIMLGRARPGPLWFHGDWPKRLDRATRERLALGQSIREAGGTFAITNQPHRAYANPFAGRSHIKAAIVNDEVCVGGANLDEAERIDSMVSWRDAATADWLYALLQREADLQSSGQAFGGQDQQHAVDAHTTLFIDAGVRGQSVIFEHALALIDNAKERLFLSCQFFPHSVTAQHLAAAVRRGVRVNLIYNRPRKHGAQAPAQQAAIWSERIHGRFLPGMLPADVPFLHAKVLASESAALIGSHNYVMDGVRFGTAEIALLRGDDPAFGRAAVRTIIDQTPWRSDPRFDEWR